MNKQYQIRNGRVLTEKEYEVYLEGLAEGIWRTAVELGDGDYHSKTYDPLFIEGKTAHSYVFDFNDGGRHHEIESLDQLYTLLLEEIQVEKRFIRNPESNL